MDATLFRTEKQGWQDSWDYLCVQWEQDASAACGADSACNEAELSQWDQDAPAACGAGSACSEAESAHQQPAALAVLAVVGADVTDNAVAKYNFQIAKSSIFKIL